MPFDKQFSIFVQNKVGSLGDLCRSLARENVNIKAISIIDDLEWGIVRVVVDDPDKIKTILQDLGLMYGESQVLTLELENSPGALAEVADKLARKKLNIEQAFATATGEGAFLVLTTTDDKKANSILSG